jgi:hypothetical protein
MSKLRFRAPAVRQPLFSLANRARPVGFAMRHAAVVAQHDEIFTLAGSDSTHELFMIDA